MGKEQWAGELSLHRDGYGFVVPDDTLRPDVFVPARFLNGAWHRDRVMVSVEPPDDRGRREGRVVEILAHGLKQMVGRLSKEGKTWWLAPNDDRVRERIRIKDTAGEQIHPDDTVIVGLEFNEQGEPTGKILRKLDERGNLATESEIVIAEHQLPTEFAAAVVADAEKVAREGIHLEKGRRDLRDVPLVTIDGETAKDFDDAVAARVEAKGVRVWIAIADVSHYVRLGTPLDASAYERGTSTYFPGFCIPMLPPALSEDVCSLRAHVERYCMVCEVLLTPDGKILETDFYRGLMKSHARLTYSQVQEYFNGKTSHLPNLPDSVFESLQNLEKIAKALRKVRRERGSVDFDLPEPSIIIDIETGDVEHILRAERFFAHFLIEELMILANECVADFLTKMGSQCIFRVHDRPNNERVEMLLALLAHLGHRIKLPRPITPAAIGSITRAVDGKPEERFINHMLLRAMSQALYDVKNIGHFGLASKRYCHFTSPIRRYPDLTVHRVLGAILDQGDHGGGKAKKGKPLPVVAQHCSKRERVSVGAEREMVSLYVASFMQQHVGDEFDGTISHCHKNGFFVELQKYFVEGVIPLSTLKGDHFVFDMQKHQVVGKRSGKLFQVGDPVTVRVNSVDMEKRLTQFELV